MVDPFTAATIGIAVIGAYGSLKAGQAAASASAERQAVANLNAARSEENADRARAVGQIGAQDQDNLTLAVLGTAIARQSSSGLSGQSQRFTRRNIREQGRRDALNVINKAEVAAFNFDVERQNQLSAGRIEGLIGDNALLQGRLEAATTLISGARTAKFGPTPTTPKFDPLKR